MNSKDLPKFFLTSLLARSKDLDSDEKAGIVCLAPEFNIHDTTEVRQGLRETLYKARRQDLLQHLDKKVLLDHATIAAEKWLAEGIFLLSGEILSPLWRARRQTHDILFGSGSRKAISDMRAAILCSRQQRAMRPDSPFLATIKSLVRLNAMTGHTIISSYGTAGYNAVSCLAYGRPTIIVCPGILPHMVGASALDKFLSTYQGLFDPKETLFVSSVLPGTGSHRSHQMFERDKTVMALATMVFAVDVRRGGNIDNLVQKAKTSGVSLHVVSSGDRGKSTEKTDCLPNTKLVSCNGVEEDKSAEEHPPKGGITVSASSVAAHTHAGLTVQHFSNQKPAAYLYHYTRSCTGPWPGQDLGQYWKSLLNKDPHSGHTGLDTLCRILEEKCIRGSARFIRAKESVVCFSELPPSRLSQLVRWRRGLTRWSVEPYGIGIAWETLSCLGAKPVIYGVDGDFEALPAQERYLFQIRRRRSLVWDVEREWRIKGNLDLANLTWRDIVVIVVSHDEIDAIRSRFDHRTECVKAAPERAIHQGM